MALLGQQFVERLVGVWPMLHRPSSAMVFRKAALAPTQSAALETANAIYAGTAPLTVEAFASLEWLKAFAHSGRQLLMCHALHLLEGWQAQRFKPATLMDTTRLLHLLSHAAGCFASKLDAATLAPLASAMEQQLRHLQHTHTRQPEDILAKAFALLAVANALQDGTSYHRQSASLLEASVPKLIGVDGSPTRHDVGDYLQWITLIQDDQLVVAHPAIRLALDRAGPFLSMLLGADQRFVFNRALAPAAAFITTMPLRHAPLALTGRLSGGKTVLIATPAHAHGFGGLSLSSHLQHLLDATSFIHDPATDLAISEMQVTVSPEGQLLTQVTAKSQRNIFLAAKGDDLRIEDRLTNCKEPCWMAVQLQKDAKALVARNGSQATIARDGKHLWQLTLHGATILRADHDQRLIVQARAPIVSWALKRVSKTNQRNDKAAAPELPF
jgi:hypothetical protein